MGSMMRRSRVSLLPSWSVLVLRIVIGYGFIAHGYAKVMNGPEQFIATLNALHVPAPSIMGWLTIVLLVAMFTVHLPYGFSSIKLRAVTAAGPQFGPPGYETNLLYLACLATLVASGPGPLAVDTRVA